VIPIKEVDPKYQIHPYKLVRLNGTVEPIDELIADAVKKLNRLGATTDGSCQGDQRADDGRKIIGVCIAHISLERGKKFPVPFVNAVSGYGFNLRKDYISAHTPGPVSDNHIRANNRKFVRVLASWAKRRARSVKS